MVSVNERAVDLARKMVLFQKELKIGVKRLKNGTFVLDCGVEEYGGFKAGQQFAEVCMGGLASVDFCFSTLGMNVNVSTDYPLEACIASQMAGWNIEVGTFRALGSGPARALVGEEKILRKINYTDEYAETVITLETRSLPTEEVASFIARKANVSPENLYILVAPTASFVGSVQISARVVETGLHKLHLLKFPLETVLSGVGTCPLAPVGRSDEEAIGITNDCILYGGQVRYFVDCEDRAVEDIIVNVPSSSSQEYGQPFSSIFLKAGKDFYRIDSNLFAPAEVYINNVRTGKIYHAGHINEAALRRSLGYL